MRGLIARLLAERPERSESFYVTSHESTPILHLQYWLALWQRV